MSTRSQGSRADRQPKAEAQVPVPSAAIALLQRFGLDISIQQASERYAIYDELGRGGIGLVYHGRDKALQRDVALKVLRKRHEKNPTVLAHFLNEAKIMAQLDHPGIVPIYDIGYLPNGEFFFAMEQVKGTTLREILDARKSARDVMRSLSELVPIFERVCQIVAYAHNQQIVHRDLKPENIMIGPFNTVFVMDWGIARDLKSISSPDTERLKYEEHLQSILKSRRIKGTPRYMSPEQAIGMDDVDFRSDVFSLGIIFYEILTGQHPFGDEGDDTRQILNRIKNCDMRPLLSRIGINPAWVSITQKALQKIPADRYPTAESMAQDIHRSLHYENVSVHRDSLWSWFMRLILRHRLASAIVTMSIILFAFVSYHLVANIRYSNTILEMAQQRILYARQCDRQIERWLKNRSISADLRIRQIARLRSHKNTLLAGARALYCAALKKSPHELSARDLEALKMAWFNELQAYFQMDNLEGARGTFKEMEKEGYLNPQNPYFHWTAEDLDRIQRYREYLFPQQKITKR